MSGKLKVGSVLKGINVFAGKPDPVVKPDALYPAWLFKLLEQTPRTLESMSAPEQKLSVQYLRIQNRERIKAVALSKK
ncbi:mitochondrial ribosomal protein L37-domain-containing protein [Chytriomyces sp. MP71]|nr:mitochondrial ribosomal protein L37-domain-containing protein [Chytriomyces sp. MP71]